MSQNSEKFLHLYKLVISKLCGEEKSLDLKALGEVPSCLIGVILNIVRELQ